MNRRAQKQRRSDTKYPIPTPRELAEQVMFKLGHNPNDFRARDPIVLMLAEYRDLLLRSASLRASAAIHKMKDLF